MLLWNKWGSWLMWKNANPESQLFENQWCRVGEQNLCWCVSTQCACPVVQQSCLCVISPLCPKHFEYGCRNGFSVYMFLSLCTVTALCVTRTCPPPTPAHYAHGSRPQKEEPVSWRCGDRGARHLWCGPLWCLRCCCQACARGKRYFSTHFSTKVLNPLLV